MSEKTIKWTEQQKRAIVTRGSDILVTASAGTGKTAVLSGRCVDIVSDKSICPNVWSILVLTFTDMAAEEMRSRIAEQLRSAFAESDDPGIRRHLRQQLILLQGADISTIHSFCKRLITEYFYKLSIDPTFKVIDTDEAKLLKAEILEKTVDWAWQQSDLQQVLEQLLYRRDLRANEGFLTKIIAISEFLDGVVSQKSWFQRATQLAEITNPSTTCLGEQQKQIVLNRLRHILAQIKYALWLYKNENADPVRNSVTKNVSTKFGYSNGADGNWAKKWQETFANPIAEYIELIESDNWEKFSERIRNHQRPSRYEYKPKDLSGPITEIIRGITETAKKSFDNIFDLAILNPEYLNIVGGSVSLQTIVLIKLVKKFDRLYSQAKRTYNCMDFADLEHHALRLLAAEDSSEDKPLPSGTALLLRQRYRHIFVDEYQDINSVQRRILDMLSSGRNILEVGDAKQSIYAFRGAEPDIFIEQLKKASTGFQKPPDSLRVDLNTNFRSTIGILDFVNKIFSRIMTASFTKIEYDESAHLKPALLSEKKSHGTERAVEFHILDEIDINSNPQNDESGEPFDQESLDLVSSRQHQAAMIARRIKQIVGSENGKAEFRIYDKEIAQFRDVEYRDIVILMRSLAKKANDYVEVLQLAGVPVSCQATAGYFETTEITDMLCLLKVLDNPQRDIEFAAVLRSPFFNISDTELTKIKLHSKPVSSEVERNAQKNRNFYDLVLEYSVSGGDTKLAEKLQRILAQLEQWRTIARRGNLADLIWQIYRKTNFLSFVSALPSGEPRRANLLKLHDRAIQFEGFVTSSGIPTLARFINFIEELQETGQDWAPAEPPSAVGNAVRILSVHKSKGLEFPVVFLAELNSQFNKQDIHTDVLADTDYTLGLQVIDRNSNSKIQSLAHQVIAEQKLEKLLAEEMRILYVATTRAKVRLILTASKDRNHCRSIITNGYWLNLPFTDQSSIRDQAQGFTLPDWQLRACQSPLDWILYALSDQQVLHNVFETGLVKDSQQEDLFSLKLYSQKELEELSRYVLQIKSGKSKSRLPVCKSDAQPMHPPQKPKSELFLQIKKLLSWQYRYCDSTLMPAKLSVTQLTHRNDEYVRFDYSRALERQPSLAARVTGHESRVTGNAAHLVISRLDLTKPINVEAIQRTKEKLLADAAVAEDVAGTIDADSILAFFNSELGRLALDKENTVWREWPFTFALPAFEFRNSLHASRFTRDEIVVVQGIIDLLIRTPQGLVIIDFKTDNITAKQVPQRAELYRRQLELYARAASGILKEKLLAKWLYFLTPATEFEIK
jgi:ATP-dependent helicase/nuclease subunit A